MKIAVFTDYRFVAESSPTGVGKHIVQMVRGLCASPVDDVSILITRDQLTLEPGRVFDAGGRLHAQKLPIGWRASDALWTTLGWPPMDRFCRQFDWVYCPKNDYVPLRAIRTAITIHGAHELDPQFPKAHGIANALNRLRRRVSYGRIARDASVVLTVSQFLKDRIVRWFGCDDRKVVVVGNGVESEFFDVAGSSNRLSGRPSDRPYVLCVGGLNELDGGALVLDAARELNSVFPGLKVVVAGRANDAQKVSIAKGLANVELAGYVPGPRLAGLMRDAIALLYVPTYETFGIAAAEAMAAGTPVITTGGSAVPEVVGGAGLYVKPRADELADAVRQLAQNAKLAESLRASGLERAQAFTWSACVERLLVALGSH